MDTIISGIQQMGIGIPHVYEAFAWYRKNFGIDVPMFDEAAEAGLMLPYTGGEPRARHAVLAINLQGGGGMEIWQYTSRTPEAATFDIQLGDYGIFLSKIKSTDVEATYELFKERDLALIGPLAKDPSGQSTFFVTDPYGNHFQIVASDNWFQRGKSLTGGIYGAAIGVSDMEKSLEFYREILGYDQVIYDETGNFSDLSALPGGQHKFRRVLLTHSAPRQGAFSKMLGESQIELIQVLDREPKKIYQDRLWGDLGFIHLCFDIIGMASMRTTCEAKGYPFTVDSSDSFDMGEAAGHFSYIEDPDGTLIEFVETHKIPIMKKLGWYLDLRKRNPAKPLPDWILKSLSFTRVKD